MKNTFGQSVAVTLFGESHGEEIGAVLDGLAPGLRIDEDFIRHQLSLRRPQGKISTARVEADEFRIVSGVFEGRTTGTPLCILIPNTNTRSKDYTKGLPRPGHADYTAQCKYHGFQDYRGGGHFSGRITAALVAAGAIAISALRQNGILIGTHISRLASICDRHFGDYEADLEMLGDLAFPVLNPAIEALMKKEIEQAASEGDSVGGVLETAVIGLPAGVGEPWFDTVESVLSHALFSIPAIKGVEFGDGFALADLRGSEANDGFRSIGGKIVTTTNHNGGINGGITNGMPVIFRCAVKPTPSIFQEQESVDLDTKENATLKLEGRHDPAIIHRARVVVDSITALALCDLLALRFGTDFPDA
ncbi:MAG: chorismate synthase [Clostridia bacterium]|nr:chorismate synthase [Clostridia bacterium]